MSESGEKPPEHSPGGLVLGPGGEDSLPVWIDLRLEQVFPAEYVRRMTAAGMVWDEERQDWVPSPAVWGDEP